LEPPSSVPRGIRYQQPARRQQYTVSTISRRLGAGTLQFFPSKSPELLFILSLNFDQGIRNIKDGPKRAKAAREMAKKIGVDIKQVYLTSGESDVLVMAETANGDNIAKLALAIGSQGNVRSRTARAWTEEEYAKLVSELP